MNESRFHLGTPEASESLLTDLYIELRRSVNAWAAVTNQTPQARMGYVGQHLVSVVTGHPGGRSGARGKDLLLQSNKHAEIKTCYRVDQLGNCLDCRSAVASIETRCPACDSVNIDRKDDSKWLIGIRNEDELNTILSPQCYFFVLFDFVDLNNPLEIRASIWRVESNTPGLAFALVDYWANIRPNSKSKAPLNIWPDRLKFFAMRPTLIYRSLIKSDDSIITQRFPGRDAELTQGLGDLSSYYRANNLPLDACHDLAYRLGVTLNSTEMSKRDILIACESNSSARGLDPATLADQVAASMYLNRIAQHIHNLPAPTRGLVENVAESVQSQIL